MAKPDINGRMQGYLTVKFFLATVVAGMFAAVVTTISLFIFLRKSEFFSGANCTSTDRIFYCYLSESSAWTDATYLQTITGFYSAIITVLIAVLAVVAALGAYTVRVGSKFQIEQELPNSIDEYFQKDSGKLALRQIARTEVSDQIADLAPEEGGRLVEYYLELEKKVHLLELQIEQMQEG